MSHVFITLYRWFYLETGAKNWTPFNGYDSLALEHARMVVTNSNDPDSSHEVTVIGDMYTVDLYQYSASLKAIYWDRELGIYTIM